MSHNITPSSELDGHYKDMVYQPTQIAMGNKLDACQHSLLRYIMRWREKQGVKDLLQARNLLDQYILYEVTGEWVNQEELPDALARAGIGRQGAAEHGQGDVELASA